MSCIPLASDSVPLERPSFSFKESTSGCLHLPFWCISSSCVSPELCLCLACRHWGCERMPFVASMDLYRPYRSMAVSSAAGPVMRKSIALCWSHRLLCLRTSVGSMCRSQASLVTSTRVPLSTETLGDTVPFCLLLVYESEAVAPSPLVAAIIQAVEVGPWGDAPSPLVAAILQAVVVSPWGDAIRYTVPVRYATIMVQFEVWVLCRWQLRLSTSGSVIVPTIPLLVVAAMMIVWCLGCLDGPFRSFAFRSLC